VRSPSFEAILEEDEDAEAHDDSSRKTFVVDSNPGSCEVTLEQTRVPEAAGQVFADAEAEGGETERPLRRETFVAGDSQFKPNALETISETATNGMEVWTFLNL
jgi:hypothetical protein